MDTETLLPLISVVRNLIHDLPPINAVESQSDQRTIAQMLIQISEILNMRLGRYEHLPLGIPGPGSLRTKLSKRPKDVFICEVCKIFDLHDLEITDSQSGPFFRICAAIHDVTVTGKMFDRDKVFREVVGALKQKRELQSRIDFVEKQIAQLPRAPGSDFIIADEALSDHKWFCDALEKLHRELAACHDRIWDDG